MADPPLANSPGDPFRWKLEKIESPQTYPNKPYIIMNKGTSIFNFSIFDFTNKFSISSVGRTKETARKPVPRIVPAAKPPPGAIWPVIAI